MNALELIAESVSKHGERSAYEDDLDRLSFSELWDLSHQVALALTARGVQAGQRVALHLEDSALAVAALIATWMVGGIPIPVNRALNIEKITFILEQADPHHVLVPTNGIGELVPADKQIVVDADDLPAPRRLSLTFPADDADAMILYTSGTTGVPKGVLHCHDALAINAIEMSAMLKLTTDDRLFLNIPFYYSNSVSHLLMCLFNGSCICATFGFLFGDALLKKVAEFQATGFGGVPAHYVRLADALDEGAKVPALRFLMNSGDHLPINVLKTLMAAFKSSAFFCVYGISECAPRVCCLPPERVHLKMGSVGPPLPSTRINVIGDDGKPAPVGEIGEVCVNSRSLMKEYFRAPQVTAESMSQWGFKTGDLGYLDEDGDLFLTGRNDAVFKSGGEKVSCRLIEETLRDSALYRASLDDVVVLAIDDHYLGKVPCVYYVSKPAVDFDKRAVRRLLAGLLPRSHVPGTFVALKEIQRSPSGKVVKTALVDPGNQIASTLER